LYANNTLPSFYICIGSFPSSALLCVSIYLALGGACSALFFYSRIAGGAFSI
jgi:hypothetical protein